MMSESLRAETPRQPSLIHAPINSFVIVRKVPLDIGTPTRLGTDNILATSARYQTTEKYIIRDQNGSVSPDNLSHPHDYNRANNSGSHPLFSRHVSLFQNSQTNSRCKRASQCSQPMTPLNKGQNSNSDISNKMHRPSIPLSNNTAFKANLCNLTKSKLNINICSVEKKSDHLKTTYGNKAEALIEDQIISRTGEFQDRKIERKIPLQIFSSGKRHQLNSEQKVLFQTALTKVSNFNIGLSSTGLSQDIHKVSLNIQPKLKGSITSTEYVPGTSFREIENIQRQSLRTNLFLLNNLVTVTK